MRFFGGQKRAISGLLGRIAMASASGRSAGRVYAQGLIEKGDDFGWPGEWGQLLNANLACGREMSSDLLAWRRVMVYRF